MTAVVDSSPDVAVSRHVVGMALDVANDEEEPFDRQDSFEQKRKEHYKIDFRAMKAAAEALDDEDDDDEDSDEAAAADETAPPANSPSKAEVNGGNTKDVSVCDFGETDFGEGHWAIGPEALHGGPKLGAGFAQSTPGSLPAPAVLAASPDSSPVIGPQPRPVATERRLDLDPASPAPVRCTKSSKTTKVLTWDEECIAEHDLLRGTRQKIEEPNTPWMGSPSTSGPGSAIHSSTPIVQMEGLEELPPAAVPIAEQDVKERLHVWFQKERHRVSIQEQWGEDVREKLARLDLSTEDLDLEEKKAKDFADKRKNHYKVDLKAMKAAMTYDDESEEESERSDQDDA